MKDHDKKDAEHAKEKAEDAKKIEALEQKCTKLEEREKKRDEEEKKGQNMINPVQLALRGRRKPGLSPTLSPWDCLRDGISKPLTLHVDSCLALLMPSSLSWASTIKSAT